MSAYLGPEFRFVEEISAAALQAQGGFRPRTRPLLVKGGIARWPASQRWTFERLAQLRRADGGEVVRPFQNGLVEQGRTRRPVVQPVAPYLRELAASVEASHRDLDTIGLLPNRVRMSLAPDARFHLDWRYLTSFEPNRVYLAQWPLLKEFPQLRSDVALRQLWPGLRLTWQFSLIGPADTVTGVHYDFPNNWFCQIAGVKEFMLFPQEQTPHMCPSKKYDWGAKLSNVDICHTNVQSAEGRAFAQAAGLYARVEAGDALYIPSQTWHAVVALTPAISMAVFGLTPWEILAGGVHREVLDILHKLQLYRRGNCICHETSLDVMASGEIL